MPDNTGELVPADLASYSRGRLDANDPGTADALAAALKAARRFCRWHVTGVRSEVLTLDGPGSPLLALPTQRMQALTLVSERSVVLPLDTLEWSKDGKVRKVTGEKWTRRYSGLVITLTHGWDDATDFHRAVLSYADRLSLETTGGRRTKVGPFEYEKTQQGSSSPFTFQEQSLLSQYRIEGSP